MLDEVIIIQHSFQSNSNHKMLIMLVSFGHFSNYILRSSTHFDRAPCTCVLEGIMERRQGLWQIQRQLWVKNLFNVHTE